MSGNASNARESDHPLFRVLVLMGSSLALGCGGSAVMDGSGANGGAPGVAGAAQGGAAQGGSAEGGAGGSADCPPAQWDCSALNQMCAYSLQGNTRPAGCVCDPQRPKSVTDCGAGANLLCLSAYREQLYPEPQSWDGTLHVQCTCVLGPAVPSYDSCKNDCTVAYPALAKATANSGSFVSCSLPPTVTCDPSGGNCTATPDSVLRQDGVVCGCASISLK